MSAPRPPIVWSIAGLDTAGGAGLSADQRAADALGVHLCPVAACLTAQHSLGVQSIHPVSVDVLQAQLQALADDMPPRAIKTGLLGDVALIHAVAQWVDRLRAQAPAGCDPHRHVALVVDPVLKASAGGAPFASADVVAAYREHLLPRATLVTPNRAEAALLLTPPAGDALNDTPLPELAARLQALGPRAVAITGGDAHQVGLAQATAVQAQDTALAIDWLQAPHAQGWLCAPRVDTPHTHGTGCTFATAAAAALALGHVSADAVVLAKMATHHALMHSHAAGLGRGPVAARAGFAAGWAHGGAPLPWLGLGTALPWACEGQAFAPYTPPEDGLYAILPDSDRTADALSLDMACVQWRFKHDLSHLSPAQADALIDQLIDAGQGRQARLFVNDHWRALLGWVERRSPAQRQQRLHEGRTHLTLGLHLGQEDLLALSPDDQQRLRRAAPALMLGLSSHSLWELARAAGCGASYIACGPVQPTTTKDMPWLPQGTDNLRWWVTHSPVPVVAIGGLLTPEDVAQAAACRPAAVCVVRGLGADRAAMAQALPTLREAALPRLHGASAPAALPHPVLP